jgi:hypothetical protein
MEDDFNEIEECAEAGNGFMCKLCEFTVPQYSISPSASILAASNVTGMVLVGSSSQHQHRVLVLRSFPDVLPDQPCASDAPLEAHDHVVIPLSSPCSWVSWSQDGALAAVACERGHVLVFSAELLLQGDVQPVFQTECMNLKQVAWNGQYNGFFLLEYAQGTLSSVLLQADSQPKVLDVGDGITSVAVQGDVVVLGHTLQEEPEIRICRDDQEKGLITSFTYPVSVPSDGSFCIDSMAFISPITLVIQVLAAESLADDEAGGLPPPDEIFFAVLELDAAVNPRSVVNYMLGPERFHDNYHTIEPDEAGGPCKTHREPGMGPFMSAAAFQAPFSAAVICSSLLSELHFMHLFLRRPDDGEDELQWQVISNAVDALQLQLPGAYQSGQQVPNYVIGAAPYCCKFGVDVLHPSDGIAPAEVRVHQPGSPADGVCAPQHRSALVHATTGTALAFAHAS